MAQQQGSQKPDHGGNFIMVPRRVLDSLAWRHASLRARVVLIAFQRRHLGKDNGRLAFSLTELCEAVGDQNRGANGRAIAELIDLGFLECTSDANHAYGRAREYRLTYIPTGQGKTTKPATHEYDAWRPREKTRKFGGAVSAPTCMQTGAETAPTLKIAGADIAPRSTVNCGFAVPERGAEAAPLIFNHLPTTTSPSSNLQTVPAPARAAEPITVDLGELREWAQAVIRQLGNARPLARDSGVPEPTLSRFRNGKALPDHYRVPLQTACGRVLPFVAWKAQAA